MFRPSSWITTLTLTLLCAALAWGQNPIPNAGFENWTNGNPDQWFTTNISAPGTITQSSDAHSGNWAAQSLANISR